MPDMLQRLHDRLDPFGAVSKKMFGGVCFMLNGNMVAGTSKRGLLVRTGKEFSGADGRDDCEVMDMKGRPMFGYWFVKDSIGDKAFHFWMEAALAFNHTLPAK
jgi:hypothetical protein